MSRRALAVVALLVSAATGALALVSLGLFADLATVPPEAFPPGSRSQAFVAGLFFAAMSAYLGAIGVRFLRPAGAAGESTRDRAPGERPPPRHLVEAAPEGVAPRVRPVPVPPEEAELQEGDVHACLRCGAVAMRPLGFSDGLAFGSETLAWVCDRCHWRGAGLTFDSPTSYRAFVKGLHDEVEREKEARTAGVRR